MNRLEFNACDYPTIGVEIELALVDNQTMALSNKNAQILNRIPTEFARIACTVLQQPFLGRPCHRTALMALKSHGRTSHRPAAATDAQLERIYLAYQSPHRHRIHRDHSCLICHLSNQIDEGTYQHDCHPMLISQNKWHASRYGMGAQLVDSSTHDLKNVPQMTEELVEQLCPMATQLNCLPYLEHVLEMAHKTT